MTTAELARMNAQVLHLMLKLAALGYVAKETK